MYRIATVSSKKRITYFFAINFNFHAVSAIFGELNIRRTLYDKTSKS